MTSLILDKEKLFVDELDGRWTLGYNFGEEGTRTLCTFKENDDWIHPHDLQCDGRCFNNIVNVFLDERGEWQFDTYDLPENWRNLVTNDKGEDGKCSIYDIMIHTT